MNSAQRPLTESQSALLDYLVKFVTLHQMPPTRAEIATEFGWASANAAQEKLLSLEKKGCIELRGGRARGIFIKRWSA